MSDAQPLSYQGAASSGVMLAISTMEAEMKEEQHKGIEGSKERFLPIDTVFKSIELIAESSKSWEDAAQQCVVEASETLKNIRELKVESMKALVDNGKIVRYRVRCRVAFAVDQSLRAH